MQKAKMLPLMICFQSVCVFSQSELFALVM